MKYLSLFSGVSADSLAWKPLGWEAAAFSEVDPFCCSLLAHHYPEVPNLGDVTAITEDQVAALGQIDLVFFSAPCQDLSVAGQRKGLTCSETGEKTRSGLFYDATRIVRWAADRCGTRWLMFENVPGMLSSNAGRDFTEVVREICGLSFPVPEAGWRNSGVVRNHRPGGWQFAWRVFDAQYGGVPQRRERVFAVGYMGEDWRSPAKLLGFDEGISGDPPSRRHKESQDPQDPSRGTGVRYALAFGGGNCRGPINVSTTLMAHGSPRFDYDSDTFVLQESRLRRMTVLEWERLMAMPPGYTAVLHNGKPASDSVRRKAIGNSIVVTELNWLGKQIGMAVKNGEIGDARGHD